MTTKIINDIASTLQTINAHVDDVLVNLAKHPEVRECFKVPSLVNEKDDSFSMQFHKFCTPVSNIREVVTYCYLIYGMNDGVLGVNKETVLAAAKAMRKSPIVEHYLLSMFHESAASVYEKEGNDKKARRHEILHQMADVKDYLLDLYYTDLLSPEDEERMESPHFRELLIALNSDPLRFQALLLYIIRYVTSVLKVNPTLFLRPQYLLVEEALTIALEQFAANEDCDAELRSCFYYYRSLYYELTCREGLAERYKECYLAIGGERDYEELCNLLLDKLPALHRSEQDFVDYVMQFNMESDDAIDMNLCNTYDLDDELPLTGFYRGQLINFDFNKKYVEAEKGNAKAIREVARCFREGDGVAACEAAAVAWESKLVKA